MSTETDTPTICHQCQNPIDGEPVRTVAGEPACADCLEDPDEPETEETGAITAGDVEGVREDMLDQLPDDAPEKYRSAWIDAVIEFDRRLTDRDEMVTVPYEN